MNKLALEKMQSFNLDRRVFKQIWGIWGDWLIVQSIHGIHRNAAGSVCQMRSNAILSQSLIVSLKDSYNPLFVTSPQSFSTLVLRYLPGLPQIASN